MMNNVCIRCDLSMEQLDLIETALNQMGWRSREQSRLIAQTLVEVQLLRSFGERVPGRQQNERKGGVWLHENQ